MRIMYICSIFSIKDFDLNHHMEELMFRNVCSKISVFLCTNKRACAIIRVTFWGAESMVFCRDCLVRKNGISEQNSSKGHFSEYGRCGTTNFCLIGELF